MAVYCHKSFLIEFINRGGWIFIQFGQTYSFQWKMPLISHHQLTIVSFRFLLRRNVVSSKDMFWRCRSQLLEVQEVKRPPLSEVELCKGTCVAKWSAARSPSFLRSQPHWRLSPYSPKRWRKKWWYLRRQSWSLAGAVFSLGRPKIFKRPHVTCKKWGISEMRIRIWVDLGTGMTNTRKKCVGEHPYTGPTRVCQLCWRRKIKWLCHQVLWKSFSTLQSMV